MDKAGRDVWAFGDYRNYFQNRVTLQLLARGRELAAVQGGELCALVMGYELQPWVEEYVAHGADLVLALDYPLLQDYHGETYTSILVQLAQDRQPASPWWGPHQLRPRAGGVGRQAPGHRAHRQLRGTGLGRPRAPGAGGPGLRRQPCWPRSSYPAIFPRWPQCASAPSRSCLTTLSAWPLREQALENVDVVVCGWRGMGGNKKLRNLQELAWLLGGQVAATRPAVYAHWSEEGTMVGQAGR